MTAFSVDRDRLIEILGQCAGAVGANGPSAAVLFAGREAITRSQSLRIAVDLGEAVSGSVLLPHRWIVQVARSAPKGEMVRVEPSEASCRVTAGRGAWTIATEATSSYHAEGLPADAEAFAVLQARPLVDALSLVRQATDVESSRYALGGVLLECNAPDLDVVATDGRRLLWSRCQAESVAGKASLVIPGDAVGAIVQVLASAASVRITRTASEVVVAGDNGVTVSARLLEGRFPRWRDIIPEPTAAASIPAPALVAAVRQAAIVTSEQSKSVVFSFAPGALTLTAQSAESGEARVECDVERCSATSRVRLDPRFVHDAIRTAGDEVVEFAPGSGKGAAAIRWGSSCGVIMPMGDE